MVKGEGKMTLSNEDVGNQVSLLIRDVFVCDITHGAYTIAAAAG